MAERKEIPAWVMEKRRRNAEGRPAMEWRKAETDDGVHIADPWLKTKDVDIYVTYRTISGRRVVAIVGCRYGTVTADLPGPVVAWMPTPEPYIK